MEVWPDHGGAITSYLHKPGKVDIIWRNPYVQPARRHLLDQPIANGSDLFDVMDGSWYVSLPQGFFSGDYYGAPVGTHGELRSVPWAVTSIKQGAAAVTVVFRGPSIRTPLVYIRELTLFRDSALMHWREAVQNRSKDPLPVAWLHHPTFGGPLLDGAVLVTPATGVQVAKMDNPEAIQLESGYSGQWPFVPERVGGKMRDCSIVSAADSGRDHSVQLSGFSEGRGCIWNAGRKLGFAMEWDLKLFPRAWSWNCGGGNPGYPMWGEGHIITLQPSTSPVGRFADLLKAGELRMVPGKGEISGEMRTGFVNSAEGPWK